MASKEALSYLDDIAHGRKMDLDAHELKEIIAKDLEVLEILKNKMPVIRVISVCDYESYCFFSELLTEEEFNKIKEWLNEGNNKN